jgi:hypothetical protein
MRKKKRKSKVYASVRHAFLYQMKDEATGEVKITKVWAKVRYATRGVDLVLTEVPVQKSINLQGQGSTSKCPMALCIRQHAKEFSHPVEGHADWTYTRAFVVSKLSKLNLPSECYAYEHNDGVGRLNDSAGGQMKLLERIKKHGPITVHLRPFRVRSKVGRPGKGRPTTGVRSPERRLRGALLRYEVYKNGAMPVAA